MQINHEHSKQHPTTYSFNTHPTYSRFIFFLGMAVVAIIAVGTLTAISSKTNPIANSNQDKVKPEPVEQSSPPPVIVNVPEQSQSNNDLGLTLEEYSNLSDPSDEVINCLKNEGGKGCFSEEYDPNVPVPYYQQPRYSSANNSQAVSVYSGRVLPYWRPSSLPPVPHGVCSRFHMVKFGDRYYCGRRLIQW